MCRAGGRRCDARWDDAHRERYNARRRMVRDGEKAAAARAEGDEAKANRYSVLAGKAERAASHHDSLIAQHEAEAHAERVAAATLPDGTVQRRQGAFSISDAPLSKAGDREAVRLVLARELGGREGEIHANDADSWASRLYHPRIGLVSDAEGRTVGSIVYEDSKRGDVAIHNMRVVEDARGEGAGRAAVESVKDVARTGGRKPRGLAVYNMLDSAKGFYAECGADVTEHSSMARFDLSSGDAARCPDCGQFAGDEHSCFGPAQQELDQWRASLTEQERAAWDSYGSIDHADLNEHLRDAEGDLSTLTDDERRTVAALDSALARAPEAERPYTVHRGIRTLSTTGDGIDGRQWVADNTPEGGVVTFHGFTSTSLDPAQAESFSGARGDYGASGVIFEVETTRGGNWGSQGPESEVTLPRGSSFEVVAVDEQHQVDGKPYPKVTLRQVRAAVPHPLASLPSEPMEFTFVRNPVSSTTHVSGNEFGQDIEPAGRYVTKGSGFVPDGWESGTIRFERPLHLDFGGDGTYAHEDNWKRRLSAHYGGKSGADLSAAIRDSGYDAVVTHDEYGTSEIVDLTTES